MCIFYDDVFFKFLQFKMLKECIFFDARLEIFEN